MIRETQREPKKLAPNNIIVIAESTKINAQSFDNSKRGEQIEISETQQPVASAGAEQL